MHRIHNSQPLLPHYFSNKDADPAFSLGKSSPVIREVHLPPSPKNSNSAEYGVRVRDITENRHRTLTPTSRLIFSFCLVMNDACFVQAQPKAAAFL